MTSVSVFVYGANAQKQQWIDLAVNGLEDMADQLNFDMYVYDEGHININTGWSDRGEVMDIWDDWLGNNIWMRDNEVHLLVIDELSLSIGAGAMGNQAIGPKSGNQLSGKNSTFGYINSAIRFDNACYDADTIPPTAVHEVGHAFLHDDMSFPDPETEHSVGEVKKDYDKTVTPMQIWYTADPCSGNSPPSLNCFGTENKQAGGATTDLTGCAIRRMQDYVNSY